MPRLLSLTGLSVALLLGWSLPATAVDFSEELVRFRSHDGIQIGCVLSYPDSGPGPFPGMLMIPGGGLHDADVTLHQPTLEVTRGEQRLFRPLARFFSRSGWAVLRCNKRGASFGHLHDQPQILASSDLDDLVQDARDALETLKRHPQVDARPLVVLGHSEGTMIATRLAQGRTDIDLLVLVGSVARRLDALIEYQLVDRNLSFLRRAADQNGDGSLTLHELDALDGNLGLDSIYVRNSAEVLFGAAVAATDSAAIVEFNPATDRDSDGRLHISDEIEVALRAASARLLEKARDGTLGEYWRSMVTAPAPVSSIHLVSAPILFVHGALDVQTPIDEALALMAQLEARSGADYDLLIFPQLGHSLSRPNDTFDGDGGLSVLDNLTLNAPRPRVRRALLGRIQAALWR